MTAVESVRKQTIPPLETVVVVDHNLTLLDQVRSDLPEVLVVENCEQPGLSGARNGGIQAASGELVAFLDDDAVAAPDWLELLSASYADPRVLGVGGTIEPVWHGSRPRAFPEEFDWVVGCTYRGMPDNPSPVRNLIGANMSFRRFIFEKIGGFRSEIGRVGTAPLGCEETELCIRAGRHWPEGSFLYEPRARVFHRVPRDRAGWRYFCRRCYAEGISKAWVSHLAGAKRGLASERRYVLRVLPRGVAAGLNDAFLGGDPAGLCRAGAIVGGWGITVAGYLRERTRVRHRSDEAARGRHAGGRR